MCPLYRCVAACSVENMGIARHHGKSRSEHIRGIVHLYFRITRGGHAGGLLLILAGPGTAGISYGDGSVFEEQLQRLEEKPPHVKFIPCRNGMRYLHNERTQLDL